VEPLAATLVLLAAELFAALAWLSRRGEYPRIAPALLGVPACVLVAWVLSVGVQSTDSAWQVWLREIGVTP